MFFLYLITLVLKMTLAISCVILTYRIAHKRATPTFTYNVFCTAFSLTFISMIYSTLTTNSIFDIISGEAATFPQVVGNLFSCLIFSCFVIGFTRTLGALDTLRSSWK